MLIKKSISDMNDVKTILNYRILGPLNSYELCLNEKYFTLQALGDTKVVNKESASVSKY